MRRTSAFGLSILLASLAIIFGLACDRHIESRDPVRSLPDVDPAPFNITALLNDRSVILQWQVADTSAVKIFRIYVSDSTGSNFSLRDSSTTRTHEISDLPVNQLYLFQISSVFNSGLESNRSEVFAVRVGLLSIVVKDNDEFTKSRDIKINIRSISPISHAMFSEDTTFVGAIFEPASPSMNFRLSSGDGNKTVYARLQFGNGNESGDLLSDDIILDTRARIDSVFFGPAVQEFVAGDTVFFGLDGGELDGLASVSFANKNVKLLDDGTDGDAIADDGIYTGRYFVPTNVFVSDVDVTGSFTDAAGNQAPQITAGLKLNMNLPEPDTVVLGVALKYDTDTTAVLTWTNSQADDFESYRVLRGINGPPVDSTDIIAIINTKGTVAFTSVLPVRDSTACFRVDVYNLQGKSAPSNTVCVSKP